MSYLINKLGALFPSSFRASGLITALMFLICLAAVQSASAATYTVTTTADSGSGSLREAIALANATIDPDTIEFAIPIGNTGCIVGICTITLTTGDLLVDRVLTAGTLTITNSTGASNLLISGNNTSRVFYVNGRANLTINGMTITKGNGRGRFATDGTDAGGGIFSSGNLTLINSIVSGNSARTSGGGIAVGSSEGTLTIENSTVSDNTAAFGGGISAAGLTTLTNSTVSRNTAPSGGGIRISSGSTTLFNSTVSGNMASSGGGILNTSLGTATLINSTVNGNSASFVGGGILNEGDINNFGGIATLTNSTVSSNTAFSGAGGILNDRGRLNLTSVTVTRNSLTSTNCPDCSGGITHNGKTTNLKNTIVAGNTAANASIAPDFFGALDAESTFNIIGNGQGTSGITNGTNGNQVGVDALLDPTLQFNGGTTPTHALLAGSPAIDKGFSFGLTTDQREFARPVDLVTYPNAAGGDGADIGAFEAQVTPAGPTAATVSVSGYVTSTLGRGISGIQLSLTDSEGNTRTTSTATGGYYRFEDVEVGKTYILSATGKRFTFSQPVQVLNINEETNEVNFIANSEKRVRSF
jgi:hypothetical protein